MIDDYYDVVVVGSGPAGSSTAKYCAENGLKVLVLDRNAEIGTPVRCGEGLSDNAVKSLKLDVPKYCIAQTVNGAIVYAPNKKAIEIMFDRTKGYILERKMFDKWLALEAARKGVKIVSNSEVFDIIINNGFISGVKSYVLGERMDIRSKVVVAADGVESIIMRKAGIKTNKNPLHVDTGYQYEMIGIDIEHPDMISLFFGKRLAPRGYIWIFPKGNDRANVGIGINSKYGYKSAKQLLDDFISQMPGLKRGGIVEVNAGCIPVGGFLKNMVSNGIVGVGDSVNQINPIHGGGIAESIKAAKIASEVIVKAIKNDDVSSKTLSEYNSRWWKERGDELRRVEKVREFFEKLNDEEMNDLAEVLSGEDLSGLAHGKGLAKILKIYMKFKAKTLKRIVI